MTVAVFGSINMDIVAYLERLPRPGETLHGRAYKLGLGGKGANQAVAARRLGGEVQLIGRLGADDFAAAAERELAASGLDLSHLHRDAGGATGIALINVGQDGENSISVIGGSNLRLDAGDVAQSRTVLERARVLLLQLEVPLAASLAAAAVVRGHGGKVVLDPAPAPEHGLEDDVLRAVDILTPNEVEAGMLLGRRPETLEQGLEAARALRRRGVAAAIVKLGARGLALSSPEAEAMIPAFHVTAVDTVAAGDCFNGGLAHALATGQPIAEAARFAAACGALSTTRQGAAAAAPSLSEVEALLRRG